MNNNITAFIQRASNVTGEDISLVVTVLTDDTWQARIVDDTFETITAAHDWHISMVCTGATAFDAITALEGICAADEAKWR